MPLNRPALRLAPGPQSVGEARRWVAAACRDAGRDDLVDTAELGVSELVTNALLHGEAPIEVAVRGTRRHPRVQVRDGSRTPPELPTAPDSDDDLLLTFGRGLSMVARAAEAWGAEIEPDGKVVWFAPAPELAESLGAEGVISGLHDVSAPRPGDPVTVRLLGVPRRLERGFLHHFRELRREVRLLALAHEDDYPLARDLSDLFGSFEARLEPGAAERLPSEPGPGGEERVDLELVVDRAVAGSAQRFAELLDLADEFCRQQRLLSLARAPEQRAFQQWYLGQLADQAAGARPAAWRSGGVPLAAPPRRFHAS